MTASARVGDRTATLVARAEFFFDFIGAWGPAILGPGHPAVVGALTAAAENGLALGATHPLEIEGILLPPSQFEAWFVSMAHGDAEIETTLAAAGEAFRA